MQTPDLIGLFLLPLNQLDLRYMVTGAVAAVVYGEPRFTRDLDLVIDLNPGDAGRIQAAFPSGSFDVPPLEIIEEEARRPSQGHFNLIHLDTALKADCYAAGQDPFHHWAMANRVRHDVGGVTIWVAPIEYVIARKLEWHRDGGGPRHVDDVRAMLRVSAAEVDQARLQEWVRRLGIDQEWRRVSRGLVSP